MDAGDIAGWEWNPHRSTGGDFTGQSPRKLNILTYMTVNFSCNVAHQSSEYILFCLSLVEGFGCDIV